MKNLYHVLFAFILCSGLTAQTVSGTVTDENGDPLPGANVIVSGTLKGSAADVSGVYSISGVSQGTHTLTVSYIGYEDQSATANIGDNGATVNFALTSSALSGATVSRPLGRLCWRP